MWSSPVGPRALANAISVALGDQAGWKSSTRLFVRRLRPVPSARTTQISLVGRSPVARSSSKAIRLEPGDHEGFHETERRPPATFVRRLPSGRIFQMSPFRT